jgi:hypothetical protein
MTKLVVTTVPKAGALLGLGRHASYEAAKTGDLPVLRIRRRLLVPVRKLEAMLELEPGTLTDADFEPDQKASA